MINYLMHIFVTVKDVCFLNPTDSNLSGYMFLIALICGEQKIKVVL